MAQARYKEPAGAETAGPLSPSEVKDEAVKATPVAPKAAPPAKRVRAKPFAGGTTVVIRDSDFARGGISHPRVEWDFRRNNFTVPVGNGGLSKEAAEYLVNTFPSQFEYA